MKWTVLAILILAAPMVIAQEVSSGANMLSTTDGNAHVWVRQTSGDVRVFRLVTVVTPAVLSELCFYTGTEEHWKARMYIQEKPAGSFPPRPIPLTNGKCSYDYAQRVVEEKRERVVFEEIPRFVAARGK
jgi:hypothetical protein